MTGTVVVSGTRRLLLLSLCYACGGGGGDSTGRDVPREVVVVIPPTDVGYDSLLVQDPGSLDFVEDIADQAKPPDIPDIATQDEDLSPAAGDAARDDAPPDPTADTFCVPNCTGRVCGPDGCGGSCGSCKANEVCQAGACLCVPNCSGRECGPDGCGGTCKPGCAAGVPCLDTGKCAKSGPCESKDFNKSLKCTGEDSYSSNNNGFKPNSDVLDLYSCDTTLAHGPEKVYRFVPDQSGDIEITLQGAILPEPPAFLNLYLLLDQGDGCTSRSCVAFGHREISFAVEAGRTYYVVVDAVQNNTASYYLTLSCSWAPATSDP